MTVRLFFVCVLLIAYCSLYYWDKLIRHFTKDNEERSDDVAIAVAWFLVIAMGIALLVCSRMTNA